MTPEARAARERKQKIFVVLGGLFLLALLAFQLPKLLGGSSSSTASPSSTTTADEAPAPTAQPVPTGSPVVHLDATSSGKLRSFSAFAPKDPFVQQVAAGIDLGAAEGEGKGAEGTRKESPATTFATGKAKAAAVTIVTVNGSRQVLQPGMKFPAADPIFVLVAEKPGSKSVVVGIVGGAYAGGAKTATVKLGKPLTLVNTTTGARYKISLVSVGSAGSGEQAVAKP